MLISFSPTFTHQALQNPTAPEPQRPIATPAIGDVVSFRSGGARELERLAKAIIPLDSRLIERDQRTLTEALKQAFSKTNKGVTSQEPIKIGVPFKQDSKSQAVLIPIALPFNLRGYGKLHYLDIFLRFKLTFSNEGRVKGRVPYLVAPSGDTRSHRLAIPWSKKDRDFLLNTQENSNRSLPLFHYNFDQLTQESPYFTMDQNAPGWERWSPYFKEESDLSFTPQ